MGKGMIWGLLSGSAAGVALLALISVSSPLPDALPAPKAAGTAPDVMAPNAPGPDASGPEAPASMAPQPHATAPAAEPDSAPEPAPAPEQSLPATVATATEGPVATPDPPPAAVAPTDEVLPDTAATATPAPQGADAPADAQGADGASVQTGAVEVPAGSDFARVGEDRAPVGPGPEAARPEAGDPAAAPAVAADVAPDAAPVPGPAIAAPRPETAAPERLAEAAPEAATAPDLPMPQPGAAVTLPALPHLPAPEPEPAAPSAAPGPDLSQPQPPQPTAPGTAPQIAAEAAPGASPITPPLPAAPSAPDGSESPGGFRPVPGIGSTGPQPGFAAPSRLTLTEPEAAPAATAEAEAAPLALLRNAAESAPAEGPLMSVLLIDDSDARPDPALLADMPVPVTIALDPARPGAAEAARSYRAAGLEVAILAGAVPPGATVQDLQSYWQGFLREVPEAMAVLDAPAARLQNDRPLARQLAALAAAGGYGVLTWDVGLNPLGQIARQDGVPELRVYRLLDAAGEEAPVIERYLDRAAFEAGRSSGIVVAGTTRPATIAAILDWAVGQRRDLTMVPVSAQLIRTTR
ncbi:divergent polysaccharide deacetylase family protein [Frigidibacter sp. MR17.14]|uniref:divergent polysaccharide deacetylase family protein n=1 Tax=Frigidibacter sp. MR17.14 TaxID=3126509 RepID=UPI003012D7A7